MGFGLGTALSIGGSLLGAMGQGKGSAPTTLSGYTTSPQKVKDLAEGDLFTKIKDYLAQGYQGIPMRRTNADDADPIFGSKSRMDYQAYLDALAAAQPVEEAPVAEDPGQYNALLGRIMAQQTAGAPNSSLANAWGTFRQMATDADYAELAKKLKNSVPGTGLYMGGYQDRETAQPIDLSQLLAKYRSSVGAK